MTERKRDDAEVVSIKNPRWASCWRQQSYPVIRETDALDG
jgi:hypothetical protein